ncbi:hypothetical protein [Dokdonella soli]|uniref:Uncharacterized protein n=1 Tax=Dokdonella soli TaxID=529810 RepID=A0ABP3U3L6_9GAMM
MAKKAAITLPVTRYRSRVERAIELLERSDRCPKGWLSRVAGTRSTSSSNPDAMLQTDIAGALGFIGNRRALTAYLSAWWPSWASNHVNDSQQLVLMLIAGMANRHPGASWVQYVKADKRAKNERESLLLRLVNAVLSEFAGPSHCSACHGYGVVIQPGHAFGRSCAACGGEGAIALGNRSRARLMRVRKSDFIRHLAEPFAAVIDRLRMLERKAASRHADALE